MYNNNNANVGAQPGGQQPAFRPQASPFGNPFYGASSGLIRGGLSAYGDRILGSSSEYVQSNPPTRFANILNQKATKVDIEGTENFREDCKETTQYARRLSGDLM